MEISFKTGSEIHVHIARRAGFCYGVKRALEIASQVLKTGKGPVYTLGPLIHNLQVVEELEKAGIKICHHPEEIQPPGYLIIRSHGLHPGIVQQMRERGLEIVDATCPFVKRVQRLSKQLRDEGYPIVVLGESNHPEVTGIRGYAGEKLIVISSAEEARKLPRTRRLGIIAQTTQDLENFQRVVNEIIPRVEELKVFNTICTYTTWRQKEIATLARKAELMLVVGGKNSANTRKLAEISRQLGVPTYHIERAEEIEPGWLAGKREIGLAGGTSTPAKALFQVVDRLRAINSGEAKVNER